jgi:hypothetical protein
MGMEILKLLQVPKSHTALKVVMLWYELASKEWKVLLLPGFPE